MKKILWYGNKGERPVGKQVEALEQLFGTIDLVIAEQPLKTAWEIIKVYRDGGYEEIVFFGSLGVTRELIKQGIKPLYARMSVVRGKGVFDIKSGNRCLQFKEFERIEEVNVVYTKLSLQAAGNGTH